MVRVGLIGTGSSWQNRYQPAFENLKQRLTIVSVFDPVMKRGQQVATELNADVAQSVSHLMDRRDLQGVCILDSDWMGLTLLKMVCSIAQEKGIYLAGGVGDNIEPLHPLMELVTEDRLTLMPEFSRRYTPATQRLHELMVTKIGSPKQIFVRTVAPDPNSHSSTPGQTSLFDFRLGLLDWCSYVARTDPVEISVRTRNLSDSHKEHITIQYRKSLSGVNAPAAEIEIETHSSNRSATQTATCYQSLICERGKVVIPAPQQIEWTCNGETHQEYLKHDRSEVEVMLDHFCRRIVGGLVGVPDLNDVSRNIRLTRAAEQSLEWGESVNVT